MARRTSPMGMMPSFSPSMGSENRPNASLISASSCAVRPCSLASLDGRVLVVPDDDALSAVAAGARRLAGCFWEAQCQYDWSLFIPLGE